MTFTLVQAQEIGNTVGSIQPMVESITTANGSMLAVWVGAQLENVTTAPMPAFSVSDSASNLWYPVALTSGVFPGARGMWWVCPNAMPVSWISVAPTGYFSNVVGVVCEFTGLPANYYPIFDVPGTATSSSGTTITATTSAAQLDYTFSIFVAGTGSAGTITIPAGMTAVTGSPWESGTLVNQVTVAAAYGTASAGTLSATWSMTGAPSALATLVVGISQASNLPAQVNANIPTVVVDMAFGSTPANVTNPVLAGQWTDITPRAIGSAGSPVIAGQRGQDYELGQPEAGTCTIGLNNQDGAFNPNNVNSPYYPNVTINTPVRVTCFWNGRRYGLFYGYVAKWPQEWPDLPQFGLSKMQCVDVVSIASTITLPGAVLGEILCDGPYASFPFNEQYSTSAQAPGTNSGFSVGSVQTPIDANGLIATNASRTNQRTATYMDGLTSNQVVVPVLTGLSLALLGDNGTGMGATAYSAPSVGAFRGPGCVYEDPNAPYVTNANQLSLEFFFTMPTWTFNASEIQVNLLTAVTIPESTLQGASSVSAGLANPLCLVYVQQASAGVYQLGVQVGQLGSTALLATAPNITSLMGTAVHLVIRIANGRYDFWVNGGQAGIGGGVPGQTPTSTLAGTPMQVPVQSWSFGQAHVPFQFMPSNGSFAMQYAQIYSYGLTASRILQHAEAGLTGFAGDIPNQRFGRLHAWSGVNLLPGAWPQGQTYQVSMGSAYDVNGQSLSSAINTVATTDNGSWYANCVGNLMYACRRALFDIAPTVTFGDSNTPGAEIPYLGNLGLDYDNTYLNNVVSTQQTNGPETLVTATSENTTSANQYFPNSPAQGTIESTSPEDAFDRTAWLLNKQSQPSMRLRAMTVDAASNPALFSKVLPIDLQTTATVNRRPMGASGTYSLPVIIKKIGFSIGPSLFQFSYIGTPYTTDNEVLVADLSGYNTLGSTVLAW